MSENANAAKIRTLNDAFRKTGSGGRIMLTQGIQAMGEKAIRDILVKIAAFDEFTEDNDPWHEHDYREIIHNSQKVLFKLDYYDRAMEYGSPDPSDPTVTTRVMTVMLVEEY